LKYPFSINGLNPNKALYITLRYRMQRDVKLQQVFII